MISREEAQHRISELRVILEENSRRYYVDNAPTMSDYEFDRKMKELESLEAQYPDLLTSDSPTVRVGSDLDRGFAKVAHRYPMLSLGNTYSISEVEEFAARADKSLDSDFTYCCELKFDGTAICLTYIDGKLVRALTRGDGVVGDDVTENVRHISNVPEVLKGDFPSEFEIRGEVLMPFDAFDALNAEREALEEPAFANPRNAASGSLKLQNPSEVAHRGLYCTLYHIPSQSGLGFETHDQALSAAESWGLPVSDTRKVCRNISEIEQFIQYWDRNRKDLPFPTDGIVIKINEMACQRSLGYTAKTPRWAVAYKFKAERALTRILGIDYQVGRTGAVTPVANLDPVFISGTMVRRSTLVNQDQMELLDIHLDDYVYVEKGGEIIPKITGVELSKRSSSKVPTCPTNCPDCGTPLVRNEKEAKWFCPNQDGCPMQIKGRLLHFISRKAMNILAGEATVEQLYDAGMVKVPSDLFCLDKYQLLSLEGWQDKSAQNFLDSLQQARTVPFERVLFALGIRFVGETTARSVARHFRDIDSVASAAFEDLTRVEDVGDIIAGSIYDYFRTPSHLDEIGRMKAFGLQFAVKDESSQISDSLSGKTIVISGNFRISRDEIKELIVRNGGKNSSSISSKTSFLLCGSKPGPEKLHKCEELGIVVMGEDEFFGMIESLPDAGQAVTDVEKELIEPTLF
ncbi:MAG: NAD-dependent DNA ligase LigA [Bacteroidales bacterium]|nr:NAD-dependent DNA ligase LigA [Bacteroidales bacterium]